MSSQSILQKLNHIQNLPTLPAVAREVNAMLGDLDTSINTLSRTIEKDQVIVSKILKLVNSAFFGLSSKVGNIPHALVLLGFNTIRNAVVALSVIDIFEKQHSLPGFDMRTLWKHSIAVAVTSKHLAETTRLYPPDDAFVGGLLHDIGKFIFFNFFKEDFTRIWDVVRNQKVSFYEAEKKEIGIDHAQIGATLAGKWKLPVGLVDTIRYHHQFQHTASEPQLLLLVYASDLIVNGSVSSKTNGALSGCYPEEREIFGPILDDSERWFPKVSRDIDSACQFFLME